MESLFFQSAGEDKRQEGLLPAPSGTILVVEDNHMVRAQTRLALESFGYRVLEAKDGEQAVGVCETHEGPVDLLIADIVMPRMRGQQVAEAVKRLRPSLKVLFVSGCTDDAVVQPETAFLQKPYTTVALANKVRRVLG